MEIHWRNPTLVPDGERKEANRRLLELPEGCRDLIDIHASLRQDGGGEEATIRCQARARDLVACQQAGESSIALQNVLRRFERRVREMRDRRIDRRVKRPPPDMPMP